MISFKTVTAILFGATLCTAQTFNISGVVQDSAGVGIVGATVMLENAKLSTTSGAGGVFTLTKSALTKPISALGVMSGDAIVFRNGMITFTLSVNTTIGISVHDVGGRLVFSSKEILGLGTHSINVPLQTAGIFLYKVTIGQQSYSFKVSSFEASTTQQGVVSHGASALAKHAKVARVIDDVIAAIKAEYLNFRCVIANSDTSGVVIKMLPNAGNITDADGNVYQSVRIGKQVWMTENLRVTKYNDGSALPLVSNTADWRRIFDSSLTTPAYCFYDNRTYEDFTKKYGALYNWFCVSPANPKKIAPPGWHVPSDAEWDTLQNFLIAKSYNWDGSTSGNKIAKAMSVKTEWDTVSLIGTIGCDLPKNNSSGFTALPGGYRNIYGAYWNQTIEGNWWSATETIKYGHVTIACSRRLSYSNDSLYRRDNEDKSRGISVRLVKD